MDRNKPLVVLNVYDLNEHWLNMNGVLCDALNLGGAFHVGVEVFGREWSFGVSGVICTPARRHDVHVYRESIPLGYTRYSRQAVTSILKNMGNASWSGDSYDILNRNCCTFARELCCKILGRDKIPRWIDRLGNGLAEVFGPTQGAGTPGQLLRHKSLGHLNQRSDVAQHTHVRQYSTTSNCSVDSVASEYAGSEYSQYQPQNQQPVDDDDDESDDEQKVHSTRPIQSYSLVSRQSFPRQYPVVGHLSPSYSSFGTVCRSGPPPMAHGVRRFVSAVF